ncbi:hypothetical protein ACF0H5_001926 [Mactra antiquata]
MSGGDYKKVAKTIDNMLPTKSVVADFKAAIWQGLMDVFPDSNIHGCAFHFSQALWRKVKELGPQTAYNKKDAPYQLLRRVFSLA